MSSDIQRPLRIRLLERARRSTTRLRHGLRWHAFARPLPRDWWPQFERDFGAYCNTTPSRPRRVEPDR